MRSQTNFWMLTLFFLLVSCAGPVPAATQASMTGAAPLPGIPATPDLAVTPTPMPRPAAWPGMQPGWMVFKAVQQQSNAINNALYDPQGYLWASTSSGLYRWEIESGKLLAANTSNLPGPISFLTLLDGKVWAASKAGKLAFYADGKWTPQSAFFGTIDQLSRVGNQLWLSTEKGLYILSGQEWKAAGISIPEEYRGQVAWLASSKDGSTWLSVYSLKDSETHVLRFDGHAWQNYPNLRYTQHVFNSLDGMLWFINDHQAISFDGNTFTPLVLPGDYYSYFVYHSLPDADGSLWLNTSEGTFNIQNGQARETDFKGFSEVPQDIYSVPISMSAQGWLFKGSTQVYLLNGENGKAYSLPPAKETGITQLVGNKVIGFTPDGALWVWQNNNMARYDGSKLEIQTNPNKDDNTFFGYGSFSRINQQGVLFNADYNGTQNLVVINTAAMESKRFDLHFNISDLALTADGGAWLALSDGFIAKFNPDDPKNRDFVELDKIKVGGELVSYRLKPVRILVSADGSVWVFAENAGLYSYNGKDWQYYGLSQLKDTTAFTIGRDNLPWAGYDNNLYHYVGGEVDGVFPQLHLPSHLTIAPDNAIWFINGCDGVYRYDGQDWTHFDRLKDLKGLIPTDMMIAPDGALWFFSNDGWARYQQ